ncbi:hypothetical protein B7R54_07730 [Subtercola boreus]|uniref:Uncharacterized protein n=1 Tax=Subtercola boreus TaxID=120213 RepID=A0A3E0VI33_9MICO|nr:hypothetical protein [Subtercola boreus]RFA09128.1 hypothetical protein B7R54_07730 [Subtercola boreus]TQL53862.1 hypothetical protein FB464_1381 [Subtercola boreus]
MTDETQNPADEAPATVPAAETGYVLTRRDRTAIHFIDWAVKFGTPEFQERYRPVTDELFTHVFIDPTAKPAFVPPAFASVEQLNDDSDPLEIIRSHLGVVIDDRKERDRARVELQVHYEESERHLADVRERAADLQERLTETTGRLEAADARIVELGEQLEAEVSGLHSSHAAELATTLAGHEASISALTDDRDRALAELVADRDAAVAALTAERDAEVARLEAQLAGDTAAQRAEHEQQIEALRAEHTQSVEALGVANTQAGDEVRAEHHVALTALEAAHAAALAALNAQLASAAASAETTAQQLKVARLEAGSLTAQRDRAIAEGSEWRNRLYQTVAALASTADVGDWTDDNDPDVRLIGFIEETQLGLASELEIARATLDEIEEVATAQLVDEAETGDYAIGANDAAVLVLNSLYGTDDEEADGSGLAAAGGAATVAGSTGDDTDDSSLAEAEEADAEFEAQLRDEVDIPFEEAAEREAGQEPHPHDDAAIGHTAVIEHTIVRDETPEIDDVDKLGSLFSDDDTEFGAPGDRQHRRAS